MKIDITIKNISLEEGQTLLNLLNDEIEEKEYREPNADANQPSSHGETDSKGLPWDERIHAISKTKTQKGEWKARRGVSHELIKQVENELRSVTPNVQPTLPARGIFQAGDSFPQGAIYQPLPQTIPPAVPVQQPISFKTLMDTMGSLFQSGKITAMTVPEILKETSAAFNAATPLTSVTDIMHNQEMINYFYQTLQQKGLI